MIPRILAKTHGRLKRRASVVVGLVGLLLLAMASWLWLTLLSPWFYQRPPDLPAVASGTHQVFVYGTLRYAPVRYLVMGTLGDPRAASLRGYRRCGLNIAPERTKPAPGGVINGLVLEVAADELARLDRYERLGVRYMRGKVTLESGVRAWVYRRLAAQVPERKAIDCPGSDTIDRTASSFD